VETDVGVVLRGRWPAATALPELGGELLAGMQFPDSPAFEVWLVGARRRLSAATEAILHDASVASLAAGKAADAIDFASRLVARSSLADEGHELLVRALASSGDEAAARRQLEATVRLFRAELGCDPSPAVFLAAEATRTLTQREPSQARTRALLEAGQAQVVAGAIDTAVRVLAQACREATATSDERLQAATEFALGAALVDAGTARHQEAEVALYRAVELADHVGDTATASAAYRRLAGGEFFRGNYGLVLARLEEAERLYDGSDSERVELSAIRGATLLDLGDHTGGHGELERAIAADPDETHPFLPILLTHAGRAELLSGDLDAAERRLEHAHRIAAGRAWAGVTPGPLALLGHVAVRKGELDEAAALLETALAGATHVADPCWETWAAHGLARLETARGDP
jgi:tetratricopeptide (TPR) repeat protein